MQTDGRHLAPFALLDRQTRHVALPARVGRHLLQRDLVQQLHNLVRRRVRSAVRARVTLTLTFCALSREQQRASVGEVVRRGARRPLSLIPARSFGRAAVVVGRLGVTPATRALSLTSESFLTFKAGLAARAVGLTLALFWLLPRRTLVLLLGCLDGDRLVEGKS